MSEYTDGRPDSKEAHRDIYAAGFQAGAIAQRHSAALRLLAEQSPLALDIATMPLVTMTTIVSPTPR